MRTESGPSYLETPSHPLPGVTAREIHSAIWGVWGMEGGRPRPCGELVPPAMRGCPYAASHCALLSFSPVSIPPDASGGVLRFLAIPKPGGDPSLPKGYRPISLLSCISKVLERIVTNHLTFYLETQLQLSDHQFGFRRTRSTEWAL